jgi:deoxyribodipyrimidine photo-lyase
MNSLRAQALAQLDSFVDGPVLRYADQRNIDRGADRHHSVSRLSAAIRYRIVLEEEVLAAVLARHPLDLVEKFVHEVCWRTYWKGWLQTNPQVWTRYLHSRDEQARLFSEPSPASRGLGDALHGRTGIKCFDAWANELISTGYLHNHARMWFASIWIFTLKLPWQLGADFFMRYLLDADAASNTLSWRWVAGLHTPGKHYLARAENILRNTEGRFDPRGQLNESAEALVEFDYEPRRQPWRAAPLANALGSSPANPAGTAKDSGVARALLLTEEDLQAASWFGQSSPDPDSPRQNANRLTAPCLIIVAREPVARSIRSPGASAAEYGRRALAEAAREAAARFACPVVTVDTLFSRAAIIDACLLHGVRDLLTSQVPVGPTLAAIDELQSALAAGGLTLHQPLRRWDKQAWPYCARGFFQFRERIPELLRSLSNR